MCFRISAVQLSRFRDKQCQVIFIDSGLFVIIIFPDKTSFLPALRKCVISKKLFVFIGGIHIKDKYSTAFQTGGNPPECIGKFLWLKHIIDTVTGTADCPHTSIQFECLHLLQQIKNRRICLLFHGFLQHIHRNIHTGHIIPTGCQSPGQFSGSASQIQHRSVCNSMLF